MHKTNNDNDHALIAQIQQGSHPAFAELVTRHTKQFYQLAYRLLNHQATAEDVVQEAFLKLWQHPNRFDLEKKNQFTTWFYQVVINLCKDKMKKKTEILDNESIALTKTTQEKQFLAEEQHQLLEQAIHALPARQKVALTLCIYQGMSNQEAADIMNINLKALQSLLVRAKQKLKQQLKSYNHE